MPTNRRELLTDGAAVLTATLLADQAAVARGRPRPPLRRDDATRAAAADDFGHLVHHEPYAVVEAQDAEDVALAVRWAARHGRRVAARGSGHAVYGRAQVRDGVVVALGALRTVRAVAGDHVTVEAGATWGELLTATLRHGLAPAVLPDYLGLSVGGTLVVGGVGARSGRSGVAADHVLELTVVTGDGAPVRCSPRRHPELFDAVRGGLGQVGVITQATLRLVPAPERLRRFQLTYPDLATLLGDQRILDVDGRFETVQGAVVPTPQGWGYRLDATCPEGTAPDDALLAGLGDVREAAQVATVSYPEHAARLGLLEQAARASGHWALPHPWLTTFVGDARIEAVVAGELERLTADDLGPLGQVTVSSLRRDAVTTPLLRLPAAERCFVFNLIRFPGDAGTARRHVAANREVYERVRDAGGTLYPVSAFPMARSDWRRHFGPPFGALAAARRTFDPGGLLTPGYEVFA